MFAQLLKAIWTPAAIKGSETLAKESVAFLTRNGPNFARESEIALKYVAKAAHVSGGFSQTTKSLAGTILRNPLASPEAKKLAAAILGTLSKL